MQRATEREQGVALVITLSLLVVATILVTGFLVSMRTERQAAQAMANSQLSDRLAQDAIEHATAILDNNIPQPVPPLPPTQTPAPQKWIVSPGLLTKVTGVDGTPPQYIPLSTNPDYLHPPTANDVNLNAQIPGPGPAQYYIIPTGEPLLATWVNVLQNPLAPASATNPIVGRYAFWMDDENAKINVNTAYGKPANLQLIRANPLDHSTGRIGYADVGFNSIQVANPNYNGTTDTNAYLDVYPGWDVHAASPSKPYAPNATVANAVGTSKTAAVLANEYDTVGLEEQARLYPLWHPSAVNLDVLGTTLNQHALADWIFNGVYNQTLGYVPNNTSGGGRYRPLSYPEQVMQFVTNDPNFYQNNKFNLTAYNRAPEFNSFGKPRLLTDSRIRTVTAASNDSMSVATASLSGVSGAETAFAHTPDFDAGGPMYFHGDDNNKVTNPYNATAGCSWADLGGVPMVADYLSTLLARNDWPGMPARSFVDKWGGDDNARREADQVAWNIVALGNYGSNLENSGTNLQDWPDGCSLTFMRNTNPSVADTAGVVSPTLASVSQQSVGSTQYLDPNRCLRLGKLSRKAIMPFSGKPYLNEVALLVNAVPSTTASGSYNVQMALRLELYAGKRCPPGTFWSHFAPCFGLTHFYYTIADASGHSAAQGADGYSVNAASGPYGNGGALDGFPGDHADNAGGSGSTPHTSPFIGFLNGAAPTGSNINSFPADSYVQLQTTAGSSLWATTLTTMKGGTAVPSNPVAFSGNKVHFHASARIALYAGTVDHTWEIVPVWDTVDSSLPALAPPAGQSDSLTWDFDLDFSDLSTFAPTMFSRSLEIVDARCGGMTNDKNGAPLWTAYTTPGTPTTPKTTEADSIGGENYVSQAAHLDLDDYSWLDAQNFFYQNCPRPSIGFLSCIPTGMQRGLPNQTLTFGPSTSKTDLPDWLLLDLLAPSLLDTMQPVPAPLSYLHSTMGKINLNAQIYPGATATRTLPMQALFKNMVPDNQLAPLANNVINHHLSGLDWGAPGQYDYIGELCEVAGVADSGTTNWQKETIIRNLANLLTTQSNTFKVYGLAQAVSVRKQAGNVNYGAVETGDAVAVNGERRFESVIERSVWPGVDGVPGNAQVNGSGAYNQISSSTAAPLPATLPWAGLSIPATTWVPGALWTKFDGPDDPTSLRPGIYAPSPGWYKLQYSSSPLKTAANPARDHMTYRPINFRYVAN